jgi:hypothetical protein
MEIGLDPDAGHRTDNLPDFQKKPLKKEAEIADKVGEVRHKHEPKLIPKPARRKVR